MKNAKNFFYDKNDIVIAVVILLLAGLIIFWRMEVIMAYPQTLAEETQTVSTTEDEATIPDSDNESDSQSSNANIWVNGALSKEVTITIEGGSATSAVDSLISAGLFTSYEQYEEICKAAGYKPENIKAKTYTFKPGSTQTDIAKAITQ